MTSQFSVNHALFASYPATKRHCQEDTGSGNPEGERNGRKQNESGLKKKHGKPFIHFEFRQRSRSHIYTSCYLFSFFEGRWEPGASGTRTLTHTRTHTYTLPHIHTSLGVASHHVGVAVRRWPRLSRSRGAHTWTSVRTDGLGQKKTINKQSCSPSVVHAPIGWRQV